LPLRSSAPVISLLEHFAGGWVQCPVAAFPCYVILIIRACLVSRHFHETVVQTKIMSYAVLPALPILSVVRELVHDELVNSRERQSPFRRRIDGHRYQSDV